MTYFKSVSSCLSTALTLTLASSPAAWAGLKLDPQADAKKAIAKIEASEKFKSYRLEAKKRDEALASREDAGFTLTCKGASSGSSYAGYAGRKTNSEAKISATDCQLTITTDESETTRDAKTLKVKVAYLGSVDEAPMDTMTNCGDVALAVGKSGGALRIDANRKLPRSAVMGSLADAVTKAYSDWKAARLKSSKVADVYDVLNKALESAPLQAEITLDLSKAEAACAEGSDRSPRKAQKRKKAADDAAGQKAGAAAVKEEQKAEETEADGGMMSLFE